MLYITTDECQQLLCTLQECVVYVERVRERERERESESEKEVL